MIGKRVRVRKIIPDTYIHMLSGNTTKGGLSYQMAEIGNLENFIGLEGVVVQKDDSDFLGVRFDKYFVNGLGLNGHCAPGHGMYFKPQELEFIAVKN